MPNYPYRATCLKYLINKVNQPKIIRAPPIGVIGPKNLLIFKSNKGEIASVNMEKEKRIVPKKIMRKWNFMRKSNFSLNPPIIIIPKPELNK